MVKRGDNYWGRVFIGGKEFKRSFGPDFQAARDALAPWRREVQLGVSSGMVAEKGVVAGDLLTVVADWVSQDPTNSDNYRDYIRNRIKRLLATWEGLADMAPQDGTCDDCNDWVATVSATWSASTVQGDLGALRLVMTEARKRDLIMVNPVSDVRARSFT